LSNTGTPISEKWIKASIIGTIWAAAEIVLGSFLHNLRVPFSGNLLTAIALVILISVSYKWRDRGLFWRAGVICALMKTMSPSAIIFGPMIAIIMESLFLEASVRLFGRTYLGFIIGSMLAMSWNLFQKVFNMIIFYGGKLVDIYASITDYASRQLNLQFDAFWAPLLLLLSVYALFGAFTAVVGIITGRRLVSMLPAEVDAGPAVMNPSHNKEERSFDYSLVWLAADILLIAGLLVIVSITKWIWWVVAVIPVITVLALRYTRAMRQLSKPGFWVTFVIITMLSALAFSALQPGESNVTEAILIGIQMNFRAVIIIVGFSALGTELYNPRIRRLFSRSHFRQLPVALELATASLPAMIADMPDLRSAVKNPVSILNRMISRVEKRLAEVRSGAEMKKRVVIVTGAIAEGKTAFLSELKDILQNRGVAVGGILALRVVEGNTTSGYDILDISSGVRMPFLRLTGPVTVGVDRFSMIDEGYRAGVDALDPAGNRNSVVVIIDEAGPLELRGEGWSSRITELLQASLPVIVIAVRNSLVDSVISRFEIDSPVVVDVGYKNREEKLNELVSLIISQVNC
jgi:nucleoside-triphosphatase THEP1